MALQYLISPIIQLEDTNGQTLVNGKVYVYHHDTDQLAVIYKDFDGGFQTNPAILDELGTTIIIADNTVAFDIEVYDKNDNFVLSRKNIYATGGGSGRVDISYEAGVDIQFRQPTQNNTIIDVVNNDCTNRNFGFAIGHNTTADYYGVAMGENTSAYGKGSVAIGYGNDVTGANQVAIGRNNKLYSDTQLGSNSLVVGDSNSALSLNKSIVYGTTNYIAGTTDGIFGGTNNSAIGSTDFIIGGISNNAENTDKGGIIGGSLNSAFHTNSIIIGGQQNIADNGGMSINGLENTVTNEYAVAFGEGNTVPNSFAVAFGKDNVVTADYAFVQGYNNTAANEYSHAEGVNTIANGPGSHSEGNGTTALGNWSHAEGDHTVAEGWHSHAEGSNTSALGSCSHTIGSNNIAYGTNSLAGGFNTIASGSNQTVFGKYNIPNETDLFQIGAGTPGNNNKNALTVDNSGNIFVYDYSKGLNANVSSNLIDMPMFTDYTTYPTTGFRAADNFYHYRKNIYKEASDIDENNYIELLEETSDFPIKNVRLYPCSAEGHYRLDVNITLKGGYNYRGGTNRNTPVNIYFRPILNYTGTYSYYDLYKGFPYYGTQTTADVSTPLNRYSWSFYLTNTGYGVDLQDQWVELQSLQAYAEYMRWNGDSSTQAAYITMRCVKLSDNDKIGE